MSPITINDINDTDDKKEKVTPSIREQLGFINVQHPNMYPNVKYPNANCGSYPGVGMPHNMQQPPSLGQHTPYMQQQPVMYPSITVMRTTVTVFQQALIDLASREEVEHVVSVILEQISRLTLCLHDENTKGDSLPYPPIDQYVLFTTILVSLIEKEEVTMYKKFDLKKLGKAICLAHGENELLGKQI